MTTHFIRRILGSAAIAGLVVAACSNAGTVASRPTVAARTPAPTQVSKPTQAPPTQAPTTAPNKPTAKPTEPKPTPAKPTAAPTAIPTQPQEGTPASQPTAAPTQAALALGQPQAIGEVSVTPSKYATLTASGTDKPKAGDDYLVITVSIQNSSKTASLNFEPALLSLFNPSGGTSFSVVVLKSLPNELKAQSLKPGQTLTGVVAYEVPHTWHGLELKFANKDQSALWMLSG